MNLEIKETTVLLTQSGMDMIKVTFNLEIEHPCLFDNKKGNLQMIMYWTADEGVNFCREFLHSEPTVVSSRWEDFKGKEND